MDPLANSRRITIALLTLLLAALAVMPAILIDPPARQGRPALSNYRSWLVGELDVSDTYAAALYNGFVKTTDERRTVLGSKDSDGLCWTLIVPADGGAPLGPAVGDDHLCDPTVGPAPGADDGPAPVRTPARTPEPTPFPLVPEAGDGTGPDPEASAGTADGPDPVAALAATATVADGTPRPGDSR